jgi:hypothetical protein
MTTIARGRLYVLLPTKALFALLAWLTSHDLTHVVTVGLCLTVTWIAIVELPARRMS